MPRDVRMVDSITQPADAKGEVVIAGSHGGISSGRYAAQLGLTGIVFNDAGVGRDEAGLRSLSYFDELGCPAATVDHRSARIGDGIDMAMNGTVSHLNEIAADVGCSLGQSALDCAASMHDARTPPVEEEVNTELTERNIDGGSIPVWLVDSIGQISEHHAGAIMIAGSHGERLAGELETYVPTEIAGITLFDAGVGKDSAGIGRLDTMGNRGIPAAAVNVGTARIGEGESAWDEGRLSHVNDVAVEFGVESGDTPQTFVDRVRKSASQNQADS